MIPGEECNLASQGAEPGQCAVDGQGPACRRTLRTEGDALQRLIRSAHLSRPENYLSLYQSGCNLACRKCHSWEFSQHADGEWMSVKDVVREAVQYEEFVTLWEPRERATAWHAQTTCRCCGRCVTSGVRPATCPAVLSPEQILLSPQGLGPARNILAFTGGDLTCRPAFYARAAAAVKEATRLLVLVETNGYGLTGENLAVLRDGGVDAFWLDIKAFDGERHRWLTGVDNERILSLPARMTEMGFTLEVLSLYIPGLVEDDELERIATLLASVDSRIPFTVLAFFPQHEMRDAREPTVEEMVRAYEKARRAGLANVRLGNLGVFARTPESMDFLRRRVDSDSL